MARKQVIEVQCDRCERVEHREVPQNVDPRAEPVAAFQVSFLRQGVELLQRRFDDLCTPCRNTIESHVAAIVKKIEGLSPERKKEKGVGDQIEERVEAATKDEVDKTTSTNEEPPKEPVKAQPTTRPDLRTTKKGGDATSSPAKS